MTSIPGATPRRVEPIHDRVTHHPALLVLRHMLERAEARSYAGLYLEPDDFPTTGSRRLFHLLAAGVPAELVGTDDPLAMRALVQAHDPELLWIVDNALLVGDACVDRWPIDRAAARFASHPLPPLSAAPRRAPSPRPAARRKTA